MSYVHVAGSLFVSISLALFWDQVPDGAFSFNLLMKKPIAGVFYGRTWLHVGTPQAVRDADTPLVKVSRVSDSAGHTPSIPSNSSRVEPFCPTIFVSGYGLVEALFDGETVPAFGS